MMVNISISTPAGAAAKPIPIYQMDEQHPLFKWILVVADFPYTTDRGRAELGLIVKDAALHYLEQVTEDWEPKNLGWEYLGVLEDGFDELRRTGGPAALNVLFPVLTLLMAIGMDDDEIADAIEPTYAGHLVQSQCTLDLTKPNDPDDDDEDDDAPAA